MNRRILICVLLLVFCSALGAAQSSQSANAADQNSASQPASSGAADEAGRPVDSKVTSPPPTQPPVRQEFRQNVKDVYFDFDRYNLTEDDRSTLQRNAEWLKAHPDVVFTIEGDADER